MFINIDGWFGSGKSVLWTLLQGHPDVYCSPLHDFSFMKLVMESNDAEWLKEKHTITFRRILANTQYYKAELLKRKGFMSLDISTTERCTFPFTFDFYAFDKLFFDKIHNLDVWSVENLIESLYAAMSEVDNEYSSEFQYKYYASMGTPKIGRAYRNKFVADLPSSKTILVKRPIPNIIATRSNRKALPEDFTTRGFYDTAFKQRIKEHEVEKLCRFYHDFDLTEMNYPKQFKSIGFNALVTNTEKAMKEVADFLEIPFSEILLKPTWNGMEVKTENDSFLGEELDKVEELLTIKELNLIEKRMRLFKFHNKPFYPFHFKTLTTAAATKIQNFIKC